MTRLTRSLLIICVLGLSAILAVGGWMLVTPAGLQFVWKRMEALTGHAFAADSVKGTLAGPLRIGGLQINTASIDLSARAIELDWSPVQLLSGTVQISSIEVDGLQYRQLPEAEPDAAAPLVLPESISFPMLVRIDRLHLTDTQVLPGADSGLIAFEDVLLSGSLSGTHVSLERLALEAPGVSLTGQGGIRLSGHFPLSAELNWHARYAGYAPLDATTRLSGSLKELKVFQQLQAPYATELQATLSDPLGQLVVDGTLVLRAADFSAINPAWPAMVTSASLVAQGPPDGLRISGTVDSTTAEFGRLEAAIDSELQPGALLVQSLRVSATDSSSELESKGRIDFGGEVLSLDVTAEWPHLAWPLTGEPVITSTPGSLKVQGTTQDYIAQANGNLEVPGYFAGQVSLRGDGDLQSFNVSAMDASAYDGNLHGTADLNWSQGFQTSIDLSGNGLNPATLWPAWSGKIDVDTGIRIVVSDADWSLEFEKIGAVGVLRNDPVQLHARGSYHEDQWQIDHLALQSGDSRASIRGRIGDTLNVEWEHTDLNLALLSPEASGRVTGQGRARGKPESLVLKATLAGEHLQYQLDRVHRLDLDAELDMTGHDRSSVQMSLSDSYLAGVSFRDARLDVTGYPRQHALTFVADTDLGETSILGTGAWDATIWRYNLTQADLTPRRLASWNLVQPVSGRISQSEIHVPESCWSSSHSRLCFNLTRAADDLTGAFRLDRMPFGYFSAMLPTTTDIQGTFDATGTIAQQGGKTVRVDVELRTSPGQIAVKDDDELLDTLLTFDEGFAVLKFDGQDAMLRGSLPLGKGQGALSFYGKARSAGNAWDAATLDGELAARLPDIAFAARLIPDVSNMQGQIDGTMKLSGTVAAPQLQGALALTNGAVTLDTPGLALEAVEIRLFGQRTGDVRLEAKARSGGGTLLADGSLRPMGTAPEAKIRIDGENFQVLNTPEAQVYASPDLQLALAGERIDVNGTIEVPRARIEPRSLPKSAVSVSLDQVIGEEGPGTPSTRHYQIHSRVRFVLGEDVYFEGLGLKGQLGGNVLVTGEPGRPATATGELTIADGKYRAYGQDLDIRTGRLLFASGLVTEPGLDVEAVRRPAADILVGVKVRGSLRAPELSLFSDPAMSQSEQLSWLVLGRPLESSASASERSALNEAALMLGLTGGEAIGKELAQTIGIDEISVSSDSSGTTTQASLLVGKYLTPELFVSYGIGIFEPVSTLKLRYTLTSRWRLVGEASALRSSADLFYVIEKGE